jgi:cytochrome c-type biogenesis protein CcmH
MAVILAAGPAANLEAAGASGNQSGATAALSTMDAAPADRAARLQERLLAPCCWSESLRYHQSALAEELRAEIDRLVEVGQSDETILRALRDRYGRRILVEPDGRSGTVLRGLPAVFVIGGSLLVALTIRKWKRRADAAPAS